jgi:hypothetical protein
MHSATSINIKFDQREHCIFDIVWSLGNTCPSDGSGIMLCQFERERVCMRRKILRIYKNNYNEA